MFFRFAAGLFLVVLVSMVGVGLEKQTLKMKRAMSRQYYHQDLLLEMHAGLRLRIQQLTAPSQLAAQQIEDDARRPNGFSALHDGSSTAERQRRSYREPTEAREHRDKAPSESAASTRLPLLRWEHPARASQ